MQTIYLGDDKYRVKGCNSTRWYNLSMKDDIPICNCPGYKSKLICYHIREIRKMIEPSNIINFGLSRI